MSPLNIVKWERDYYGNVHTHILYPVLQADHYCIATITDSFQQVRFTVEKFQDLCDDEFIQTSFRDCRIGLVANNGNNEVIYSHGDITFPTSAILE